jgi:hypothetical protein
MTPIEIIYFTFAYLLVIMIIAFMIGGTLYIMDYIIWYGFEGLIEAARDEITDFINQTADFMINIFK